MRQSYVITFTDHLTCNFPVTKNTYQNFNLLILQNFINVILILLVGISMSLGGAAGAGFSSSSSPSVLIHLPLTESHTNWKQEKINPRKSSHFIYIILSTNKKNSESKLVVKEIKLIINLFCNLLRVLHTSIILKSLQRIIFTNTNTSTSKLPFYNCSDRVKSVRR